MGDDASSELRLVCICGQRMRISPAMYGKPGKCVSCKQKIRVPKEDEIPTGVTVISLDEHPEFLRRSDRSGKKGRGQKESAEVVLGEGGIVESPGLSSVPMDILEPLRALVSLEYRITHKLSVLRSGAVEPRDSRYDPRQLERYLERIRDVRRQLEEELRQKAVEAETELESIQERLGQLGLNAKAGELEFVSYREQAEKLRRRRDTLARRLRNLNAWLAVRSPYEAGGYIRLPMDHEPDVSGRIVFRHEPEANVPLVDWWVRALRDALTQKEFAERKIAESQRMEAEGLGDSLELGHRRADAEGERDRAIASITFCKERLEQLERDYKGDLQILGEQLSLFKGRLTVGGLTKEEFNAFSKEKARLSAELMGGLDLIRRALHSGSSKSLPKIDAIPSAMRPRAKTPTDAILLWVGAGLILVSLFLPMLRSSSAFELVRDLRVTTPEIYWLLLVPLSSGVLLFAVAFTSSPLVRGAGAFAIGFLLTVGFFVFRQECLNSTGLLGDYVDGFWLGLARPGGVVFVLALVLIFVAGVIAVLRVRLGWLLCLCVVWATLVGSFLVATDFIGLLSPRPVLFSPVKISQSAEASFYDVEISIGNQGRRPLIINPRTTYLKNGLPVLVEKQVGEDQWEDVGNPLRLIVGDSELQTHGGPVSHTVVLGGTVARLVYRLRPGTYRVTLLGGKLRESFSIQEPALVQVEDATVPEPPSEPITEPEPSPEEPTPEPEPVIGVPDLPLEVELGGFLVSEGRPPQFRLVIYYPNGQVRTRLIPLLGELDEGWYVAEFNRDEETVTLSKAGRYLILRRGKREVLTRE